MIFLTNDDHQRQMLAADAARALATMAGWKINPVPIFLPRSPGEFIYSPGVELILASWRKDTSLQRLMSLARETRLDVLHVEPGRILRGIPIFYVTLILCRNGGLEVYRTLRLWSADVDSSVWLVPDPADDQGNLSFDLQATRLMPASSAPYAVRCDLDAGLTNGKIRWHATAGGHLL